METQNNSNETVAEKEDLGELFLKIKKSATDTLETVKSVADHDAIKHDLNAKGISLLEVKNQLMLQYMLDLTLVMSRKVSGQSIHDDPAVWRMIENRTFLEKIQPIESKMKYQIDKLVKSHKFGETDESDALKFKPNLDNFGVQSGDDDDDDDSDEEDKEDGEKKEKGVYKAPKLAPMHYTGDETVEERQTKKTERLKKRALSSTMMEELRHEYMEEPEEIKESADLHRVKQDRQRKERQEYEEQYFVRTSVSKKELNKGRKMATISSLDALLKFDNLAHLDGDGAVDEPSAKKRKTSKGSKGKGKGKKGKGKKKKFRM
ncbi:neuroguidin-like [Littorina saxatilis]|uniref:Neuroguidin n=1 Tax=Littorina saxatilis TaxID=31220 RepID=A0AAN9C465_9CAEN